jgi:hypothetical protein
MLQVEKDAYCQAIFPDKQSLIDIACEPAKAGSTSTAREEQPDISCWKDSLYYSAISVQHPAGE